MGGARGLRRAWAVCALALASAGGVAAQPSPPAGFTDSASALARVDSLYFALDAGGSFAAAEALATDRPGDGAVAWRAARAAVSLGMLAQVRAEEDAWYRRAEAHAARAVASDSASVDGLFWLGAARGRIALKAGPRDAARLGQEVWRLAHRVLELQPDHPGAHNMLGVLQYEVMTLSRVERFLARLILGDNVALRTSSWEGAEREQRRAVELQPDAILYRYDLARVYARRNRPAEAVSELEAALALPPRHPPDPRIQEYARGQLAGLRGER